MKHVLSSKGIIDPSQSVKVPIFIEAQKLGLIQNAVQIHIAGHLEASVCQLKAHAKGIRVTTQTNVIDWGAVFLSQENWKTVS